MTSWLFLFHLTPRAIDQQPLGEGRFAWRPRAGIAIVHNGLGRPVNNGSPHQKFRLSRRYPAAAAAATAAVAAVAAPVLSFPLAP